MGKSKTTKEERQEAVQLLAAGMTGNEVAKKFGVSRALVYIWKSAAKRKAVPDAGGTIYADLLRRVQDLEVDVAVLKKGFLQIDAAVPKKKPSKRR